jgi:hypothetical protein
MSWRKRFAGVVIVPADTPKRAKLRSRATEPPCLAGGRRAEPQIEALRSTDPYFYEPLQSAD